MTIHERKISLQERRDAADEIERLTERCEAYKGQVKAGAAEIERLRAALEPFAREADTHGDQIPDEIFIWDYEGEGYRNNLRVGDLRRARDAIRAPKEQK